MAVELEPVLDVHDIQGNILAGFNKDTQILMALVIEDVPKAKAWLRAAHPFVSSTSQVLHFNRLFRSIRARTGSEPVGLAATWFNLAFTHEGIAKLTSKQEADDLPDAAFQGGLASRSANLSDPLDPESPFHPNHWVVGGPQTRADVLLIIASDAEPLAEQMLATLMSKPGFGGFREVYRETGRIREDEPGHEHFGFKDGVSQPGCRGRASARKDDFITPRLIDPSDPLAADFSRPGQPLIMPGHFVLGYATQDPDDGTLQEASPLAQDWFKNGSFLVFRRLRQDVAAFRRFLSEGAKELVAKPGFSAMTPQLLGSLFVGRWANGAPITRSPAAPDNAMAADIAGNAFAFQDAMGAIKLMAGVPLDATPPAPADPNGALCPFWSHIRKVNPRDDSTDLGDGFDTLTRRMLRRGVPYGPSLPQGAGDDGVDRGLLFLAYHASIQTSFETVTVNWVNRADRPSPDGNDPVIGETNEQGSRQRHVLVPSRAGGVSVRLPIDVEWVHPTGGEYFFAPSLSAIGGRLSH